MRIITHDAARHNAATAGSALFRWGILFLLTLTVSACSRDAATEGKPSSQAADPVADCALTTDTSAWTAFKEVADRIAAGADVTKEELIAFGNLPTVTLWRHSMEPGGFPALLVGNWLEGTFWEELDRKERQKRSANRTIFTRSYHYSLNHRDRIDRRLAELTGPRKCDVSEIARFWIEPGLLPQTLTIHFLPAKAEIRIFEGSLLVDTGLVGASRVDQLIRQMAALLYSRYQSLPGPNPIMVEGDEAVAHSFRLLMNVGVACWIEQAATLEFDRGHITLGKTGSIPEEFFLTTQDAIGLMNRKLGSMLDDEARMAEEGTAFAKRLARSEAFSATGYGMSSVIAARLGEDRLRQVSRSVPAFLAAYQEAAAANPFPIPVPGDLGHELFQTVPPLDPDIFTKLHAMLTRIFPD